ncbi:anhydro-N-acetylmuramic acid kinase [Halogeometricum sp. CBA1124]|nr:anhydro-N-acetylmuramic acid kinase [Halogeometricum sp. CBA1124]
MSGTPDDDRNDRYAIGLMSGTSLDGIDAACCRIRGPSNPDDPYSYDLTIESFVTEPYSSEVRDRLVTVCDDQTGTVDEVCRLNVVIAEQMADLASRAWEAAGLTAADIDVVASHGQTVWHVPESESVPGTDRRSRSTLQIGDGCVLAARTGVPTVSDFRMRDIAAGGHGAPLAPYLDGALFAADDVTRAVQNIGGIGNCTLLPSSDSGDDIRAFDTGPGNMVVDAVVEELTSGERTYDVDGELAAAGEADTDLVASLLEDPYFDAEPPKSTGREYFGHDYARRLVERGKERRLDDEDIVATATMLTAQSIADAYERFAPQYPDEIYVSGGGVYNPTLLRMLRDAVDSPVARLSKLGVDGDQKEAALFSLLGITRLDGVPNNVPSATGSKEPVVMGKLSLP